MKLTKDKLIYLFFSACLLFVFLAAIPAATDHYHHCVEPECEICACIDNVRATFRQLGRAPLLPTVAGLLLLACLMVLKEAIIPKKHFTLVAWKARMDH